MPLPVINQACMMAISKDSCNIHATVLVTDKYIPPAGLICIPSWSVLKSKLWCSQKSTSYHWKYVHVVQTKFYTCYLLKTWATLVRGLRFNCRQLFILNHRCNTALARILLRYSLQKVQLLVFSDPQIRMISTFRASFHCPSRSQSRKLLKIARFCLPAFRR